MGWSTTRANTSDRSCPIPWYSSFQLRLTYIFRVSDLSDRGRVRFGVDRVRPDVDSFEAHHPDRIGPGTGSF
jgi:hypothetical protein